MTREQTGSDMTVFRVRVTLLLLDDRRGPVGPGEVEGSPSEDSPDRWGRALMRRMERRRAMREGGPPRTLQEIDYLLLVDDEARIGALRFAETAGGPFLRREEAKRIPPIIELPRLLSAAQSVLEDKDSDEDLKLLFAPGSSLGGARPKASLPHDDRHLAIAKFPRHDDEYNVVVWESVALQLARRAGIAVPDSRIEDVGRRPVIVLRRFDRIGQQRIPFVSAMSMLGSRDNETHSYMEIADSLRQHGASPKEDVRALWRRMVFNILVSNTDDHLRNHGFVYESTRGWRLSPTTTVSVSRETGVDLARALGGLRRSFARNLAEEHPVRARWVSVAAYGFLPDEGAIRSTPLSASMSTGFNMW